MAGAWLHKSLNAPPLTGAPDTLGFLRATLPLHARKRSRFLDRPDVAHFSYAEWDEFFELARRHGFLTAEEIAGPGRRLRPLTDKHKTMFASDLSSTMIYAMLLDNVAAVRAYRDAGKSAWDLAYFMRRSRNRDEQEQRDRDASNRNDAIARKQLAAAPPGAKRRRSAGADQLDLEEAG